MAHWALKYQGAKWTDKTDCLHWFALISKEQFGRTVPGCSAIDHGDLLRSTIRVMRGNIVEQFGFGETNTPQEGDAAFLTQRKFGHHIGMVIFLRGKLHVMHVLEGCGLVISDEMDLSMNGWRILSYWTPCDSMK